MVWRLRMNPPPPPLRKINLRFLSFFFFCCSPRGLFYHKGIENEWVWQAYFATRTQLSIVKSWKRTAWVASRLGGNRAIVAIANAGPHSRFWSFKLSLSLSLLMFTTRLIDFWLKNMYKTCPTVFRVTCWSHWYHRMVGVSSRTPSIREESVKLYVHDL